MQQYNKNQAKLPRVERTTDLELEAESSDSWAISYADFLMVLLSFFILFFSMNNEQTNDLIMKISQSINSSKEDRTPSSISSKNSGGSFDADSFRSLVKNLDVQVKAKDNYLIIMFPDNSYAKGESDFIPEVQKKFDSLIKTLLPYSKDIEITFFGHTDGIPLVQSKTKYMQSNFDLSSYRASKALEHAKSLGMNQVSMFVKGAAANIRNSRTLSILIKPRRSQQ